jgi:hypothetical protein
MIGSTQPPIFDRLAYVGVASALANQAQEAQQLARWERDSGSSLQQRSGEGVDSVRKVAEHASIPLSWPTLDHPPSRLYQGFPVFILGLVTVFPLSSRVL